MDSPRSANIRKVMMEDICRRAGLVIKRIEMTPEEIISYILEGFSSLNVARQTLEIASLNLSLVLSVARYI